MTERGLAISDGAAACPFVAFEDERDERSSVPDHRHRCYAETPPAPRAIAHQEAYCLSTAFPVCPVFQDWARREAARTRGSSATGAAAAAGAAGAARVGGAGATSGAAAAAVSDAGAIGPGPNAVVAGEASDDSPEAARGGRQGDGDRTGNGRQTDDPESHADGAAAATAGDGAFADRAGPTLPGVEPEAVRRNPPRDWAAPPPWLASTEGSVGADPDAEPPAFLGRRTQEAGQGLAGSAADRLAGGQPPARRTVDPDRWAGSPPTEADRARSEAIAGAAAARGAAAAGTGPRAERAFAPADEPPEWEQEDAEPQQRRITRRPRAYAQHLGGPDGPDWERPRRYEAYPTIRTRVGMPQVPRLALLAGLVLVLAIALFLLPGILNIGGGPSAGGPAASASAPTASRPASHAPTVPPAPTPTVYTVKKGDTLSKIAARNGLTLDELLAANPDIKNPNKVGEGQQIIIPAPGGGSANPAAS